VAKDGLLVEGSRLPACRLGLFPPARPFRERADPLQLFRLLANVSPRLVALRAEAPDAFP
jgi:hypothetical protein